MAVLAAGVAGALLRYAAELALARRPAQPPGWLFVVNIAGSALLGALIALADDGRVSADVLLVAGTGFCGALTTFSAFSLSVVRVGTVDRRRAAALAVVMLVTCGLAAAAGTAIAGVL